MRKKLLRRASIVSRASFRISRIRFGFTEKSSTAPVRQTQTFCDSAINRPIVTCVSIHNSPSVWRRSPVSGRSRSPRFHPEYQSVLFRCRHDPTVLLSMHTSAVTGEKDSAVGHFNQIQADIVDDGNSKHVAGWRPRLRQNRYFVAAFQTIHSVMSCRLPAANRRQVQEVALIIRFSIRNRSGLRLMAWS